jgi:colanic acid biosynthesis glycosyl transferase WcaI
MKAPAAKTNDAPSPRGKNVLILSAYFHPEPTGSAPPITDLAAWLAEQGARAHVATARPSYPQREVFEGYRRGERDHEVVNGVEVDRVAAYVSPSRGALGRLRTELSVALRLLGGLTTGRLRTAERVICVCPSAFVVAIAPMFCKRGGRVLCIVHDLQSGLAKSLGFGMGGALIRALRTLERWSFNRCDTLVALTDEMAAELRALGAKPPVVVIPPQVDVREIRPAPERPDRGAVLLYSGNLGKKQGLDQILELAAVLQRRGRREQIVIRGEGSERSELNASIAEAGIANVTIENLAARDRLSEALAEGAIHLAPQNPEGATFALPSKIFSIMAAQRPFLATAHPGTPLHRFAGESGAGLCARPYDAEALADAAEALLDDAGRRRRMGRAGRDYVERYVDREVVCRAIWYALNTDAAHATQPLQVAAEAVAPMRVAAAPQAASPVAADGDASPLREPRTFVVEPSDQEAETRPRRQPQFKGSVPAPFPRA